VTTTYDQGPTWCEIVSAAIDAAPQIIKQARTRSHLIAKAREAFIEQDDVATAVTVLGDLVEKAGAALPELPESKLLTLAISKSGPDQRQETAASRLIEKRNRLVPLRSSLRSLRGQEIGKTVTIATRLTKSEIERRDLLRQRLDELKARLRLAPGRSWQPLQQEA
jgi:hypothetical protein